MGSPDHGDRDVSSPSGGGRGTGGKSAFERGSGIDGVRIVPPLVHTADSSSPRTRPVAYPGVYRTAQYGRTRNRGGEVASSLRELADRLDGGGEMTLERGGRRVRSDPANPVRFGSGGEWPDARAPAEGRLDVGTAGE
jgi:hypothetical protein